MIRRPLAAAALALLASACAGTEVGNPDGAGGGGGAGGVGGVGGTGGTGGMGGTGGTGGGAGGVVAAPDEVDFGTTCPGGVARSWIDLANQREIPTLVELAAAEETVALVPASLEIEALGAARSAAIYSAPLEASGPQRGSIAISWDEGASLRELPWSAEIVAAAAGRSQVLCGGEGPCEAVLFVGEADEAVSVPLAVANDGCAALTVTGVEVLSGGPQPALAGELPMILEPGTRWSGALELTLDAAGSGSFRLLTDEAAQPAEIPFEVVVGNEGQSTR